MKFPETSHFDHRYSYAMPFLEYGTIPSSKRSTYVCIPLTHIMDVVYIYGKSNRVHLVPASSLEWVLKLKTSTTTDYTGNPGFP